jgi:hypothetical protein
MPPVLVAVSSVTVGHDIGRGLIQAFYMFWETLWALVLGFGLSGAVQAFVSREGMRRRLGDHRPASVARASGYGMISSSCSYAASAMAKSLFQKGADFVTSMVFMFASTNLVVELGIVLAVLIGWQFVLSEFVGGTIMIILLALGGALVFRGRLTSAARERLGSGGDNALGSYGGGDAEHGGAYVPDWRRRIRSADGWADAASFTMADLRMLRREMAIGYLAAGYLATLVPVGVWNNLFIPGHGFWTSLENVAVGPLIALLSCVCSIGNVPLAAALWKGGISFGGVVSFIFADLIALPLLLVYRRFYGIAMALRMLAVFWVVMSLAGLITGELFMSLGIVPTSRPQEIAAGNLSWNATTVLNFVFLLVFAVLYRLCRKRVRTDSCGAVDPVCGMPVEATSAAASTQVGSVTYSFCSDRCKERFVAEPGRYVKDVSLQGDRL